MIQSIILLSCLFFGCLAFPVYNGVPTGVNCTHKRICFDFVEENVCADVCETGSVILEQWAENAMVLQNSLSRQASLCYQQAPGSHNSAISLANGYGTFDGLFTSYVQKIFPSSFVR